jgi:hypothetical protein
MNTKTSNQVARNKTVLVSAMLALLAVGAGGQSRALAHSAPEPPTNFSGLLNDYTPTTANGNPINGAPYEMHGVWALNLNPRRGTAAFSAEMSMETSEVVNPPPYDPAALRPHTHHISVTDGVVHDGPTDWMNMCPTNFSPPIVGGFVVTGSAYVTGNGANAPFGNPSPVTICVLGGASTGVPDTAFVEYANVTLTFAPASPASSHFGELPIHGVVVRCKERGEPSQSCRVAVQ